MDHPCRGCHRLLEGRFRFCPWCATPQRSKHVELFRAHRLVERDPTRALRVSRYLAPDPVGRHVRLSVWDDDVATAAISLDDDEAERLGRFLCSSLDAAGRDTSGQARRPGGDVDLRSHPVSAPGR